MGRKLFRHLHIPEGWRHYWTKYPEGYTILESLLSWASQVDDMVEQLNKNTLDIKDFIEKITDFINDFTAKFGENLAQEVVKQLTEWLKDGTLADIITEEVLTTISTRIEKVEKTFRYINVEQPPQGLLPIAEGATDNVDRVNAMIDQLKDGGELFFPSGRYPMEKPIKIFRPIRLTGHSPYRNRGTSLIFDGTNGIELFFSYVDIRNITIEGENKKTAFNLEQKELGTVGLYNRYNDDGTSGGTKTDNVSIMGFNVGYASVQEGSETSWAGAYRENRGLYVSQCDVGLCFLDGATFDTFFGGRVIDCTTHGVYASLPTGKNYNRIEFIGTCFEAIGYTGGNMDKPNMVDPKHGLYVKNNSKIKFTNCYFELVKGMTDKGASMSFVNCHIHNNFKMYGKGTTFSDSHGEHRQSYIPQLEIGDTLQTSNCEATVTASTDFRLRVTSDKSGNIMLYAPATTMRGLIVDDLLWTKLSFRYKVIKGFEGTGFGISAMIRHTDSDGNLDNGNRSITHATSFIQPEKNQDYQYFEFYQYPRKDGEYLNRNSYMRNIQALLHFYNAAEHSGGNYINNNLEIEISDLCYTVYTRKETSLS